MADAAHECARGGGKRAYGARLLLAGFAESTPEIWSVGPGGDARVHYPMVAVGKHASRIDIQSWDAECDAPAAVARAVAAIYTACDAAADEHEPSIQIVRFSLAIYYARRA